MKTNNIKSTSAETAANNSAVVAEGDDDYQDNGPYFMLGILFYGGAESSVQFVALLLSVKSLYTHIYTHRH